LKQSGAAHIDILDGREAIRPRFIRMCYTDSPSMPDIVLTTLNAKYPHASFGLRYLMANLGEMGGRAEMLEFDINQRSTDVVESIVARSPAIVGMGVYIWNAEQSLRVAAELKRVRSDVVLVLGGPEVSYETEQQEIVRHADYVITGEGDLAFGELCEKVLAGRRPIQKVIAAELPEFAGGKTEISNLKSQYLKLPYHLYTDHDIAHRVVYVEASRGCPFKCEFCLSSLDVPLRNVPLDEFLSAMQSLLDRGLRQFKFVDRTFNLNLSISKAILEFFLERYRPGLFMHFEMIPDRLPDALRGIIRQFPPAALQFEVGVQTFNERVAELISRRQDNAKLEENLRWLRAETGVHVHADLIVGLPGEDVESFAAGFDRLVGLGPQEIQVGMLKRLRGTPIVRHDAEWGMVYSPHAPYEVLSTRLIDFATMQRLRRFARYWDLIGNSGNFRSTLPLILGDSAFARFLELSDCLYARMGRNHGIALADLAEFVFAHLRARGESDPHAIADKIWADYQRAGRSDRPEFLRPFISERPIARAYRSRASAGPRRQARHLD
jgi:radical SAM superfamily enzyme YgiQ (UPF0313 family)